MLPTAVSEAGVEVLPAAVHSPRTTGGHAGKRAPGGWRRVSTGRYFRDESASVRADNLTPRSDVPTPSQAILFEVRTLSTRCRTFFEKARVRPRRIRTPHSHQDPRESSHLASVYLVDLSLRSLQGRTTPIHRCSPPGPARTFRCRCDVGFPIREDRRKSAKHPCEKRFRRRPSLRARARCVSDSGDAIGPPDFAPVLEAAPCRAVSRLWQATHAKER